MPHDPIILKEIAKSTNKPIVDGPERFTPKLYTTCPV